MINVTVEELEKVVSTIDEALGLHAKWRETLERSLACRLPPPEASMTEDAHLKCAFGHWFYSKGNAHLRNLPAFIKIGKLHQAMHDSARTLCIKSKALGSVSVDDYDLFLGELSTFKEELLSLQRRVSYTLKNIDPLTGAFKQPKLLPDLREVQQRLKESTTPYSLLLMDIDLKTINKNHGRNIGDKVLRSTIMGIREVLSAGDKIYRYGGAEFVICLPGKNENDASAVREQLLKKISEALVEAMGDPNTALNIYHSIVELNPDAYLEELLDQATRSTYTVGVISTEPELLQEEPGDAQPDS